MNAITLMTDFGVGSPYVAEMKGVILSIAPGSTIVDITHDIHAQDVAQGALTWRQVCHAFPKQTIHIGVVDPGVGTHRGILLVKSGDHYFIGPDNGLLSFAFSSAEDIWLLDQSEFWRSTVSNTFHGRDIMAPVAAHLFNGVPPTQLGTKSKPAVCWDPPTPTLRSSCIEGEIIYVDSFGNLITNLFTDELPVAAWTVEFRGQAVPVRDTYANGNEGSLLALFGSGGWLELAISNGNAEKTLQAKIGETVSILLSS